MDYVCMCQARPRVGVDRFVSSAALQSIDAVCVVNDISVSPPGGEVGLGACAPGRDFSEKALTCV